MDYTDTEATKKLWVLSGELITSSSASSRKFGLAWEISPCGRLELCQLNWYIRARMSRSICLYLDLESS